jgi:radical SAM family protein
MNRTALLLFPPNWTACVNSPHLGLPLLCGSAKRVGWNCETWDLSERFYRTHANPPARFSIVHAAANGDFATLDRLYFDWEDQLRSLPGLQGLNNPFGLLSGYSFAANKSLRDATEVIKEGTIYTNFLNEWLLPQIVTRDPAVVGVTIASQEQLLPAIELLLTIRSNLPNVFLVLGGNVVTRLRETNAFRLLQSLVDQIVIFQGDQAFADLLRAIDEFGVVGARKVSPGIVGDELIPYQFWPVPDFTGIAFDEFVGTPALSYVSTRGCYWGKCHFCAIPAGWSTKGYGGSAPGEFVADQLIRMVEATGIRRIKFVDEAIAPAKTDPISDRLRELGAQVEWEAYARLEPAWEDGGLLTRAYSGGLRKLYFGLEQAPNTDRSILGKNDRGDMVQILQRCHDAGIKVHLFCMVGHPGSSRADAQATVDFLVENDSLIDTADLVGFRLDRGTTVSGVRSLPAGERDWSMSLSYEPCAPGVLSMEEVDELEFSCQETLWEMVPRLLHPLYRIATNAVPVESPN